MTPNLFIVGFQKCGSSTLFDLLSQHPAISPSSPKETFFLSDQTFENYNFANSIHNPNCKWQNFFSEQATTTLYRMEGSVCNFYQETAFRMIQQLAEAKVVFILRDPIDRFVSNYKYYSSNGLFLTPGTSLSEYYMLVQSGNVKKEAMIHALEHGHYSRYIDKWIDQLGKDRVYILGLKPLVTDAQAEMKKLFHFLGLEPLSGIRLSHKNQSKVLRFPKLNAILVEYLGNKGLGKGPVKKLYRLINRKSTKISVSEEIKQNLEQLYQKEYERWRHLF